MATDPRQKEKNEDDPVEQVVTSLNNAMDDLELADNELNQDLNEMQKSTSQATKQPQNDDKPQDDTSAQQNNNNQSSETQNPTDNTSPSRQTTKQPPATPEPVLKEKKGDVYKKGNSGN